MTKTVWILLTAVLLAAPLAACGKKGGLEPPPGTESNYPRQYPNPDES